MEDLIIEIIGMLLEPLLEALLEFLAAAMADVLLRSLGELFEPPETQNSFLATLGHAMFGLALGGLSLVIFGAAQSDVVVTASTAMPMTAGNTSSTHVNGS